MQGDPKYTALHKAIHNAGGPSAVARKLGITPQAISQWTACPLERVIELEALSGVSRFDLSPDHFGASLPRSVLPGAKEGAVSYNGLTQLGRPTAIPESPDAAVIEKVPNPEPDARYVVRFVAPEFTALCPLTGQPDFAHLVIDYVPGRYLVESKSLKLFLASFRNHGSFHEACTLKIARHLTTEIEPQWLRIGGYWYPRGGIPIDVFYQTGPAPDGIWLPDQGVAPYRGRG